MSEKEIIDYDATIDPFENWYIDIAEKCEYRTTPLYFYDIDEGKEVLNTTKIDFCRINNDCENQSCDMDSCPKRN